MKNKKLTYQNTKLGDVVICARRSMFCDGLVGNLEGARYTVLEVRLMKYKEYTGKVHSHLEIRLEESVREEWFNTDRFVHED